jgi:hypothetical protein
VAVRRDSFAPILKLVEDGLLAHNDVDDLDLTELQAAFTDLHTAMAPHGKDPNSDEMRRNETKTETRRPSSTRARSPQHNSLSLDPLLELGGARRV